ncbi:MAG: hypothetical protein ACK5L3_04475 [Oscillospiraceae bacterium]
MPAAEADAALAALRGQGENAYFLGEIVAGDEGVLV